MVEIGERRSGSDCCGRRPGASDAAFRAAEDAENDESCGEDLDALNLCTEGVGEVLGAKE